MNLCKYWQIQADILEPELMFLKPSSTINGERFQEINSSGTPEKLITYTNTCYTCSTLSAKMYVLESDFDHFAKTIPIRSLNMLYCDIEKSSIFFISQ